MVVKSHSQNFLYLPILMFAHSISQIDFETAKRYREANKMPHQFRRAAWTDLTVEVYL